MTKYQIMTFSPVGHPMSIDNKTYNSREEVEQRKEELEKVYDCKLFISEK